MTKTMSPLDHAAWIHPDPHATIAVLAIFPADRTGGERFVSLPDIQAVANGASEDRKKVRMKKHPITAFLKRRDLGKNKGKLLGKLRVLNNEGYGIYISTAGYKEGTIRRKAENVVKVTCLWADVDKLTDASRKLIAGQAVGDIPPPGLVVITSPDKYQLYWRLEKPITEGGLAKVKPALSCLAKTIGADPAVADLARVLRLADYQNTKPEAQRDKVSVISREAPEISFNAVCKWADLDQAFQNQAPQNQASQKTPPLCADTAPIRADVPLPEQMKEYCKRLWTKTVTRHNGDGWAGDWAVACYLAYYRLDCDDIVTVLTSLHPSQSRKHGTTARRAIEERDKQQERGENEISR